MNMSSATRFSTNLHPLLWITGISVSLLAIVGIASLTGLIVPAAGPGIVAELNRPLRRWWLMLRFP